AGERRQPGRGPAQVAVRAGRVRLRPGARRRGDAGRVLARAALPAGRQRPAVVLRVRHPAEPGVPRPQAVDGAPPARARRLPPVGRAGHRPDPGAEGAAAGGRGLRAPPRRPAQYPLPPLPPRRTRRAGGGAGPAEPEVLAAVQAEGTVFLTSTELGGRFALRACTINFRTTEADLDTLVQAVRVAGELGRRG